jgi:uncharacterized RDD family membrane protein YckC
MDQAQTSYAGFWMRFLAYIIDAILLGVVSFLVFLPLLGVIGLTSSGHLSDMRDNSSFENGMMAALIATYMFSIIVVAAAGWLYFALMESSAKQATLGKLALGLRVTDMNGNRITFGRATGRYFGKLVSGLILYIGFIMAGFTQQKQALHDIMAGTLVLKK